MTTKVCNFLPGNYIPLTSFQGICMADVCNLITEAKADTQLHQVIATGLELVNDHPRCLPGGGDFNIWPFVVETLFWKLRLWISIKVCSYAPF